MITQEDIKEACSLISSVRACLSKIDRHASRKQSYRLNQAFSHIEKAKDFLNRLANNE